MESQSSLVWAYGAVELHTVSDVDLYLALVVHPGDTESDDALWLHQTLYDFGTFKLRVLVVYILNRNQHFFHCLQVFSFAWMLTLKLSHDFLNLHSLVVY